MEIQKQISHNVGHLNHANSVPSVIQNHMNDVTNIVGNTQSNNETGVIKELRSFLSNYSTQNRTREASILNASNDISQNNPSSVDLPTGYVINNSMSNNVSVINQTKTRNQRYNRNDVIADLNMSSCEFKTLFPNLVPSSGEIPDSYYFLTIAEVSLENLKARDKIAKKPYSGLESKMKVNHAAVHVDKAWDKDVVDNLKTKLHPLRFDRAPTISSEELFVKAAEHFETNEFLPIDSYDLSRLDLTNKITLKGFEELHNPTSRSISIKMFSPENVKKSQGGMSNVNVVHDDGGNQTIYTSMYLEDIENIKHFQIAFFALMVAKKRIVPWDGSIEPLFKFFIVHDWLRDIPNSFGYKTNQDQGSFCAAFTDSVLHTNAMRFSQKQPHLSFADLDAHFRSFCSFNPHCGYVQMIPVSENKNSDQKSKQRFIKDWSPSQPGSVFIHVKTICKTFNSDKSCSNKFNSKTRRCSDPVSGAQYLHVCNVFMPSGKPCGQSHNKASHDKK